MPEARDTAMRKDMLIFGPDEFKVLQQIVDSCMAQLNYHPTHRHADKARLRQRVSKQVFKHAAADILDVEAIKRKVLAVFQN